MRPCLLIAALVTTACAENTDSPRTPPPPPCTTTADCTTGTCLNSRCVADGSIAGGQTCDLDQQCRSGTCPTTDNTCEYAIGEVGGPCDTSNACDAGVSCLVNICVAEGSIEAGSTCSLPEQCISGECLSSPFICAAGPGESCETVECATGATCLVNTCVADGSLGEGQTCSEDEQCASGDCTDFLCAPGECEPTGPVGGTSFTGSADAALANDAVLVILWSVTSGNDYSWIFGDATASGTSLSVNLSSMPPAEAVNSYGLAIGVVVAFPAGTTIDPGLFIEPDEELVGASDRHAIIWKANCGTDLEWSAAFSPGYACGSCVPASRGQTFDSFVPTDCSNVMLNLDGLSFDWCNWT